MSKNIFFFGDVSISSRRKARARKQQQQQRFSKFEQERPFCFNFCVSEFFSAAAICVFEASLEKIASMTWYEISFHIAAAADAAGVVVATAAVVVAAAVADDDDDVAVKKFPEPF